MPTISLSTTAKAERVTLENLMQLYVYDWSELRPLDVGGDGRFEPYPLDSYFEDDWRHPILLRVDGRLAGFALVSRRSRLTGAADVFDMAEFFVMRRYRRKGVGLAAAAAAFDRFKGPWEIRQQDENVVATAFWRRAVDRYNARELSRGALERRRVGRAGSDVHELIQVRGVRFLRQH